MIYFWEGWLPLLCHSPFKSWAWGLFCTSKWREEVVWMCLWHFKIQALTIHYCEEMQALISRNNYHWFVSELFEVNGKMNQVKYSHLLRCLYNSLFKWCYFQFSKVMFYTIWNNFIWKFCKHFLIYFFRALTWHRRPLIFIAPRYFCHVSF